MTMTMTMTRTLYKLSKDKNKKHTNNRVRFDAVSRGANTALNKQTKKNNKKTGSHHAIFSTTDPKRESDPEIIPGGPRCPGMRVFMSLEKNKNLVRAARWTAVTLDGPCKLRGRRTAAGVQYCKQKPPPCRDCRLSQSAPDHRQESEINTRSHTLATYPHHGTVWRHRPVSRPNHHTRSTRFFPTKSTHSLPYIHMSATALHVSVPLRNASRSHAPDHRPSALMSKLHTHRNNAAHTCTRGALIQTLLITHL